MTLAEIARSFATATSLEKVCSALERCSSDFGCPRYTYFFTDIGLHQDRKIMQIEADAEFLTNLDPAWTRRYLERQYFVIDPIVQACYQSRMPVIWSSDSLPPDLDAQVGEMLLDAHQNGLQRGISVPIHGFAGSFGIFSLYSPAEERPFQEWAAAQSFEIQRFAFWFHDFFASRFSNHQNPAADEIKISIKDKPSRAAHTLH
jgi:GAF domain-containing protein